MIPRSRARLWLAGLWLVASLVLAGVLFVQTVAGGLFADGDEAERIWDWFSGAVLPNVSLMLGVVGMEAFGRRAEVRVRSGVFWLAFLVSLAYLLALATVIVWVPLTYSLRPLEASSAPLEFFQALANLVLGIFFVTRERLEPRDAVGDGEEVDAAGDEG